MNKELEEHKTYYLKPLYISSRYITNDEKGLIREYIDKQDKEIEKLNNIINEKNKEIEDYSNKWCELAKAKTKSDNKINKAIKYIEEEITQGTDIYCKEKVDGIIVLEMLKGDDE